MQNFNLVHQRVFELLRDNQNKWYEKLHDDVTNDVIGLKNNRVLVLRNSNPHVKFQPTVNIQVKYAPMYYTQWCFGDRFPEKN